MPRHSWHRRVIGVLSVAAATIAAVPSSAQQSGAPNQKPQPTFETQSTVVLLDIIVRDKKGRPVRIFAPMK